MNRYTPRRQTHHMYNRTHRRVVGAALCLAAVALVMLAAEGLTATFEQLASTVNHSLTVHNQTGETA